MRSGDQAGDRAEVEVRLCASDSCLSVDEVEVEFMTVGEQVQAPVQIFGAFEYQGVWGCVGLFMI